MAKSNLLSSYRTRDKTGGRMASKMKDAEVAAMNQNIHNNLIS